MWKLDKQDNNLDKVQEEQKEKQETKDSLLNFWKWNEENDDKLLKNPNSWNKVINSMKEDIIKKHNELNDPNSKEKIENLTKSLDWYTKLWKLNKEQAKELSEIYNQIVSIESTEHAEDTKSWEEASKSIQTKKQEYINKLDEATERLDKLLKNNHEEAMNKQKQSSEIMQEARKNQQEPPSAYASLEIPPSQKESPTATA